MPDEKIRLVRSLTSDEARLLLDSGECALYRSIQRRLLSLVREYEVQLPLNCLQFFYYINGYTQTPDWYSSGEVPF